MKQAEYYEFANDLYKVLIPVWERSENFKELQQAHGQLGSFFTTLWTVNETRMFGKYFRVGFYGTLFGDMDGHEFVYREKGLTVRRQPSFSFEPMWMLNPLALVSMSCVKFYSRPISAFCFFFFVFCSP